MNDMLSSLHLPDDMKQLSFDELAVLAYEVRLVILDVCSANGGQVASSLGAVELSIALHRVLVSTREEMIWDVGH